MAAQQVIEHVAEAAVKAARYPHMMSKLTLKNGTTLRNRVIMGSMHTGLEEAKGGRLEKMAAFYAARAKGGAGLIVTGGIAPSREGWVAPFAAKLTTQAEALMHREVTEATHAEGGKIAMQILHSGRYGYHPLAVAPSPIKAPIGVFTPRALDGAGVRRTIDDYARATRLAAEAGYDGVELMGSEGYLINQFIASRTNKRQDEWGGSFENRIRLALEVVRAARREVNPDFVLVFRLSMLDLVDGGSDWAEVVELAKALEESGVDIINTGIGWHEARIPTIATSVPRGAFSWVTKKLKEEADLDTPLVATNRINMPQVVEDILSNGHADLVSMARPFLADAEFVNKAAAGRPEDVNTCIGCNQACLDHTFKMMTASCLVNPVAGYEQELSPLLANKVPASRRLSVAVVGAGPAGLAAACTAAERGHAVTLFEASGAIGGQFNLAKQIPGKEEFHETIRYFRRRLEALDPNRPADDADAASRSFGWVEQRLGAKVDAGELVRGGFDKVILGTGVTPRALQLPDGGADHPKVLAYADVLRGDVTVGDRVAVVGAGGIGFDVAEFLTHAKGVVPGVDGSLDALAGDTERFMKNWGVDMSHSTRSGLLDTSSSASSSEAQPSHNATGREVTLLQRKRGKLGAGLGKTTGWIHRASLQKAGVQMVGGVKSYDKVDDEGLHVTVHGSKRKGDKGGSGDAATTLVIPCDHVVVCAGQEPLAALATPLKEAGVPVFLIGGAEKASELDAKRAIDQGTRLAAVLEDAKCGDVYNQPVSWEAKLVAKGLNFFGKNA